MSNFSFGSDPEFLLVKNGTPVSAIGVVPGNKEEKHKVGRDAFYYDNVMAEMEMIPATCREQAVENIGKALGKYAKLVRPCVLVPQAAADFSRKELSHPEALRIGCDPEFCVYSLRQVVPPANSFKRGTLRSAGGHVHIGSGFAQDPLGCYATIRMMDLFMGVPSIFLDHDPTSKKRKALYGQAGRFRQPPHGAEYRSMGNFWFGSPRLVEYVYDTVAFVLEFLEEGRHNKLWYVDMATLESDDAWMDEKFDPASCHKCIGYDANAMRKAINTMDRVAGEKFIAFIKPMMPARLFATFEKLAHRTSNFDMYKEWQLEN